MQPRLQSDGGGKESKIWLALGCDGESVHWSQLNTFPVIVDDNI
jgi:hypothetical protein